MILRVADNNMIPVSSSREHTGHLCIIKFYLNGFNSNSNSCNDKNRDFICLRLCCNGQLLLELRKGPSCFNQQGQEVTKETSHYASEMGVNF